MPKKSITAAITPSLSPVSDSSITKTAHVEADKALALVPTYQARVEALTVQSDEDYAIADAILGQINDLRKGWGGIWKRVQTKVVKPIRDGLEELYKLNRDVDGPLEALATGVRAKMTAYQREKLRLQQDQERRDREERERLEREAEEKRKKAEAAATPQLRGRFQAQAEQLETKAQQIEDAEPIELASGSSSSSRRQKAVELDAAMLMVGMIEGTVPMDLIDWESLKRDVLRRWKLDAETVESWPGVQIVDDINVVSR